MEAEERKRRNAERMRQKYAADPEYRARKCEQVREWSKQRSISRQPDPDLRAAGVPRKRGRPALPQSTSSKTEADTVER